MLSKSRLSELRALHSKKLRQKYGKYIIEGQKSVMELLAQRPDLVEAIYYKHGLKILWEKSIESLAFEISDELFDELSQLDNNQGVMAVVRLSQPTDFTFCTDKWYLLLDAIQDPGNLGTIIRTADWFGFDTILLAKGTVSPYNSKVVQASMGSVFRTQLIENVIIEDFQNHLTSDFKLVVADMEGISLNQLDKKNLSNGGIIVMGNEGNGVSEEYKNKSSMKITIPKSIASSSESLNVAVATGIVLYHWSEILRK